MIQLLQGAEGEAELEQAAWPCLLRFMRAKFQANVQEELFPAHVSNEVSVANG